jgi:hypothetical protein
MGLRKLNTSEMGWNALQALANWSAGSGPTGTARPPAGGSVPSEEAGSARFCAVRCDWGARVGRGLLRLSSPDGATDPASAGLLVAGDRESTEHLRYLRVVEAVSNLELPWETFCI